MLFDSFFWNIPFFSNQNEISTFCEDFSSIQYIIILLLLLGTIDALYFLENHLKRAGFCLKAIKFYEMIDQQCLRQAGLVCDLRWRKQWKRDLFKK